MEQLLLLLPGSRAGRRLGSLILDRAIERQVELVPPNITTLGRLPDQVLVPRRETATSLAEFLGWVAALRAADRPVLERLLGRQQFRLGDASDESIEAMAKRLIGISTEVSGAGLSFQDVLDHEVMQGNPDSLRWRDLSLLQQWQHDWLDGHGLEGRDARFRDAIDGRVDMIVPPSIGLISADMNQMQRRLLDLFVERGTSVFTMIHADRSSADAFDSHGCVEPDHWKRHRFELADGIEHVADGPEDQAACLVDLLGSLGPVDPDDVSIGLPDAGLLPHCHRVLSDWGVPVHDPAGIPMTCTRIARLVGDLERFLGQGLASDFAALLREPMFERWVLRLGDDPDFGLLDAFDRYREACLPMELEPHLPNDHIDLARVIRPALDRLDSLRAEGDSIGECVSKVERVLLDLVHSTTDLDEQDQQVLRRIGSVLDEVLRLSPLVGAPRCRELLRMLRRELSAQFLRDGSIGPAVELLGWLECHLDDASTLLIAGCNEGLLPMSLNSDAYLPNELRRAIGLVDNDRRWARDAHLLQATLSSGRTVHVISGRHGSEGDSLVPSRLLLTGPPELIAERVLSFTGDPARFDSVPRSAEGPSSPLSRCPRPERLPPVNTLSVTAFADYLSCPYRFMLKHVLRLRTQEDEPDELNALAFGSLAHDVLESFGHQEAAAVVPTTDVDAIRDRLEAALDDRVRSVFGRSILPAVQLQIDLLRWRLGGFAVRQAEVASEGWKIDRVELSFGRGSAGKPCDHPPVPFPGRESMLVRGRIDRIDVHSDGRVRVLDYKTGNERKTPDAVHRRNSEWVNLQLPLYRRLVSAAGYDVDRCAFGYISLPASVDDIRFEFASWGDDEFDSADAAAIRVIDGVLAGDFEPSESDPPFHDDWRRICGTSVLSTEDDDE